MSSQAAMAVVQQHMLLTINLMTLTFTETKVSLNVRVNRLMPSIAGLTVVQLS